VQVQISPQLVMGNYGVLAILGVHKRDSNDTCVNFICQYWHAAVREARLHAAISAIGSITAVMQHARKKDMTTMLFYRTIRGDLYHPLGYLQMIRDRLLKEMERSGQQAKSSSS
jgi:hypothetical protein